MEANASPSPRPLTDEEQNFAAALVAFFGAMEQVAMMRRQLAASGGDAFVAFMSTLPEDQRESAALQWPMISTVLSTLGG